MKIRIQKVHPRAVIPEYAHGSAEDSGMDLYSVEDVTLRPMEPKVVKTGLKIEIPPFCEGQVRSRSGLAAKNGIWVLNSPGTIDAGYRGEIGVILCWTGHNPNRDVLRNDDVYPPQCEYGCFFQIPAGSRIAQLVFAEVIPVNLDEVDDLTDSKRGEGGFGSTGV